MKRGYAFIISRSGLGVVCFSFADHPKLRVKNVTIGMGGYSYTRRAWVEFMGRFFKVMRVQMDWAQYSEASLLRMGE